jgi:hypothetical protein
MGPFYLVLTFAAMTCPGVDVDPAVQHTQDSLALCSGVSLAPAEVPSFFCV